jgi:hypothetical protein
MCITIIVNTLLLCLFYVHYYLLNTFSVANLLKITIPQFFVEMDSGLTSVPDPKPIVSDPT